MTKGESMDDRITVRTTMEPDKDIEMTLIEAEDLRRQGLLVPAEQHTELAPAKLDTELDAPGVRRTRKDREN